MVRYSVYTVVGQCLMRRRCFQECVRCAGTLVKTSGYVSVLKG